MFMVTLIDYRLRYGRQSSFWTAPIIKTIFKGAAGSLVAFIFTYMFIIQFKLLPLDPLTHWGALLQLFVTGGVYVLLALLLTMLLGGVEYQALKSIIFRLSGRRG